MSDLIPADESGRRVTPYFGRLATCIWSVLTLCVVCGANAQTLEVLLENPPIPPALGDYRYDASGASVACRGGWPSEAALIACEQALAGSCGAPDFSPAGAWADIAYKAGAATSGERRFLVSAYLRPAEDEPCTVRQYDYVMSRSRTVACPVGYLARNGLEPGYCEPDATAVITGTPPACLASGGGDARRGNPCDAATGDKLLYETDYTGPVLRFVRTYHSTGGMDSVGLGAGWSHTYGSRLIFAPGDAVPRAIVRSSGYVEFLSAESGLQISRTGSGLKVGAADEGWIAYLPAGEREHYDPQGRLLALEDAGGRLTRLVYGAGRLSAVTGPFGHRLEFAYDKLGRLVAVTDPAGGQIHYEYDLGDAYIHAGVTVPISAGRLLAVTYQDGSMRQYLYEIEDLPTHLTGVVDENGSRFATYAYDALGRVTLSEHGGGIGRVTLSYTDLETAITDADGYLTVYTFSGPEQISWMYRNVSYSSMRAAIIAARTDPTRPDAWNVRPARWQHRNGSASGEPYRKLIRIELDGARRAFEFDATDYARRPLAEIDEDGIVMQFSHDSLHRTAKTEAADTALARTTTYSDFLEPHSDLAQIVEIPSVSPGDRLRIDTRYHPGTRLVATRTVFGFEPSGGPLPPRQFTYGPLNAANQVLRIDGPRTDRDDSTVLAYYATDVSGRSCSEVGGGRCGQLSELRNALGHLTTFDEYSADGRLIQVTDPNQLVTRYEYSPRGRLIAMLQSGNGQARETRYERDATGLPVRLVGPGGEVMRYHWNSAQLIAAIEDQSGSRRVFGYDGRGNLIEHKVVDPSGEIAHSVEVIYDARNRPASIREGGLPPTVLEHDPLGNLVRSIDAQQGATSFEYDALRRMTSRIDALGGEMAIEYDVHDQPVWISAQNGVETRFVLDDFGQVLEELTPDVGVILQGFDPAGQRVCRADAEAGAQAGQRCGTVGGRWQFVYDALGRVTEVDDLATPSLELGYDYDAGPDAGFPAQFGRLSRVLFENEGGTIVQNRLHYDLFGNLLSNRQTLPDAQGTLHDDVLGYAWDAADRLVGITYPSGRELNYARDAQGRIAAIESVLPDVAGAEPDENPLVVIPAVRYYPMGRVKDIEYHNGLVQSRRYDQASRIVQIDIADADGVFGETWAYSSDDVGNITRINQSAGDGLTYAYDALNRLVFDSAIDADGSPHTPTYVYDSAGNRLRRNSSSLEQPSQQIEIESGSHRPASLNALPFRHDLNGNATNMPHGVRARFAFGNRLTSLTSSRQWLRLDYNGTGGLARTRLKTACGCGQCPSHESRYFFGPAGRALAMSEGGTVRREVHWLWLDALPVAQITDLYAADGEYLDTQLAYLHADHLGAPRLATGEDGEVLWRWWPDAFGGPQVVSDGSTVVNLRLPGQIDLNMGGIYYNHFRAYNSVMGRYLQPDPVGLRGGVNRYGYALANPVRYADPQGLEVLLQSHPVALGFNHAKLTIVPENQSRWRDDPRFSNALADGRRFMTLGAGPEWGDLVSRVNRKTDLKMHRNATSVACEDPDSERSEDELIEALLAADSRYRDNHDYEIFPLWITDGFNSNSYVSGLLRATGIRMDPPPNTPGFGKPLPMSAIGQ